MAQINQEFNFDMLDMEYYDTSFLHGSVNN